MKTKLISALLVTVLAITSTACNKTDTPHDHETGVIINHLDEAITAGVTAAFFDAQDIALYFTGYGQGMYTDGTIELDGGVRGTTQYDRFSMCDTMAELRETAESVFTEELAEKLIGRQVGAMPLFHESEGVLYRFGGFVSQYGAEAELIEILGCRENKDGSITLSVKAIFPGLHSGDEDVIIEHDYTCIDIGGEYRFTGEFTPLVELAAAEIFGV